MQIASSAITGLLITGLIFLVFFLVGIILIFKGIRDRKKASESLNWSSAPGRVVESRVKESVSTDNEGGTSVTYAPHIRYEYSVMGIPYSSDHYQLGTQVFTSNLKKTREAVNARPIGSTVNVFYNPNNPADATIEQKSGSMLFLILGIVFAAISLCLVCPLGLFLLLRPVSN